jgi:hypothetical protein
MGCPAVSLRSRRPRTIFFRPWCRHCRLWGRLPGDERRPCDRDRRHDRGDRLRGRSSSARSPSASWRPKCGRMLPTSKRKSRQPRPTSSGSFTRSGAALNDSRNPSGCLALPADEGQPDCGYSHFRQNSPFHESETDLRPRVFPLTRAPRRPALRPAERLLRLRRRPGTIVLLLRKPHPISRRRSCPRRCTSTCRSASRPCF